MATAFACLEMRKHHEPPAAFAELGIQTPFLSALQRMGFSRPTEIQQRLIPLALAGRDVLGQARTGTGKTAAFGLPLLQLAKPAEGLQGLVLVPTRELAVQVAAEMLRLAETSGLRVVPVYGGQRIRQQVHLLGRKPHFVVGTPGRVMDFLDRRILSFSGIRFVVLDEVDRMLDIGFRDDIKRILSQVKTAHQTILVSATMTDEIKRLAEQYMTDPVEVNVSQDKMTVDEVRQSFYTVDRWDKYRLLRTVLDSRKPKLAIVFCNTKHAVRKLAKRLNGDGINAREIHGDLVQAKRDRVMSRFRKHAIHVLVATDLAARGIDVQGITHIINYDIPDDPLGYVHRIGRTARMGCFGEALTFVTREEGKQLTEIEKLINREIPCEQMEGFEPSPPPEQHSAFAIAAKPEASVDAPAANVSTAPKRLGAKFRPVRRRRL
ncbi:MAG TPA: DEAD/DEAH box helicase [Phycisphaerae bacterium]|nr:DEAD/DEAH box helicase [Phycisphaerae bacterium]HRR83767.1 DEAD/DEAH box helicase [Phycisphaerae bacterium]